MAHTPGPWGVENDRITSKYGDIAALHFQSARNRIGVLDADDARLIAAAPELLAVLERCNNRWDDADEEDNPALGQAIRAAIAKAIGKESE